MATQRLDHLRVLVAEADGSFRSALESVWAKIRPAYTVSFVSDGSELIEYLTHTGRYAPPVSPARPDLLLINFSLPVMDGREAIKTIKAIPAFAGLPFVVFTASEDAGDRLLSYRLGARSYIVKPTTMKDIEVAIKNICRDWVETLMLSPENAALFVSKA
ncbi:MAG: response regulator [Planctomycetes bacterium]|nr:response regulator [Planctomycetota bacterium]NUQ34581.1 response regulator [Planctomycetaceae bacterium]